MIDIFIVCSAISAVIFAVLLVLQSQRLNLQTRFWRSEIESHARSIKNSLTMLRGRCSEAINLGEVLRTPESKHFARDMGWALIALENDLGSLLPVVDEEKLIASRGIGSSLTVRPNPGETEEFHSVDLILDRVCEDPGTCADRPDIYWEELEHSGDRVLHHRRRKDGIEIECGPRQEYYKALGKQNGGTRQG